jgi:ABC-type uncharacterized transport system involved in gliding motility auxiliary subunit
MSALLGALGLVALLFTLASFVMALIQVAHPTWVFLHGVAALLLLCSAAAINLDGLRERMRSGEARRAGKYGSNALISTVLAIAILGMGGFLASRYSQRFDWSEQKVHTLSDQTLKLLAGLEQDVEVVALFGRQDWQPVRDQLARYQYVSERFKVLEIADPTERPDLLERYQITPTQLGQGLIRVAYGGESVNLSELGEVALTNAIVKLTRVGGKTVYFLEGHNENAIRGEAAAEADGFEQAAEALRNENYTVESLLLASHGDVPEDADVVIVAGPTRSLQPQETDALDRYLKRGGAVMALVDPRARTDLVDTLLGWGVDLGDDVIVDRQQAIFGQANTPFAEQYDTEHEITKSLREVTLFHVVRSVKADLAAADRFSEIVFTGLNSWAETDLDRFYSEGNAELDDADIGGPVPIAVAGSVAFEGEDESTQEGRLVVYGDADFASNQLFAAYQNRDLFVNSVNWLLGDVEAISIRPNQARASGLQMNAFEFEWIRLVALFALPEALAVTGVFVWWRRRRPVGQ